MSVSLNNFPAKDQNNSPTQDGQPDENHSDNCGEACDSAILKWAKNLDIEPDTIKDQILGQGVSGDYSYVYQHVQYLESQGIAAESLYCANGSVARQQIAQWLSLGHPVIILLYWNRVNQTGGHFVTGTAANDDGSVVEMNPWGGWFETLTPAAFDQAFNGWLIHVECGEYKPQVQKYVVNVSMMARSGPDKGSVYEPVQMVNKGAVLDGTGKAPENGWVEVTAGGRPVWILLANCTLLPGS